MKKILLIIMMLQIILLHSLDFKTVIKSLNNTFEIKNSKLETTKLENDLLTLKSPDDISLSLSPTFKTIDSEDTSLLEEIEITGSISAKLPLGLSKLEKEKVLFASEAINISLINEQKTKFLTFVKLYRLYKELWLVQTESDVLVLELEASIENVEILNNRFKTGSTTLLNLNNAIETQQQREADFNENMLKQRLAMYELMFTIGKDMDPQFLDKVNIKLSELPNPKELYSWVIDNHPQILIERIKLEQLFTTQKRLIAPDFEMSLRPFYNSPGNDVSTSINYNLTTKDLTPVVSMNIGNSSDTWSTGITMNMSIGSNNNDKWTSKNLILEIEMAQAELEYLQETLNLNLKSSYQKYLQNKELVTQAKRNLNNSNISNQLVLTKIDLGQLSNYELLESNANVKRSQWKVDAAIKEYELSWLNVLEDSSWYNNLDIEYE